MKIKLTILLVNRFWVGFGKNKNEAESLSRRFIKCKEFKFETIDS